MNKQRIVQLSMMDVAEIKTPETAKFLQRTSQKEERKSKDCKMVLRYEKFKNGRSMEQIWRQE